MGRDGLGRIWVKRYCRRKSNWFQLEADMSTADRFSER